MKNRIIVIFTLVTGLFLLNSCLKDTADYWSDQVAGKMYITVLKPALQTMPVKPVPDTLDFSFMLNIASDALPPTENTIKVEVDPAAVTTYNNAFTPAKNYKAFPTVRILNPTVTIAAGARTATIHAQVWGADKLSACDNFIAAITIKSITDPNIMIPANMKSYLLSLPISNPYEGKYHVTGVFTHPVNGPRAINEDKVLSTVNCNTVSTTVGDLAAYEVTFTVNADNSVTVGGAGLGSTQPIVQGTGVNKYDPATKTFTVDYYYAGSGGNRTMQETYVVIK